MILMLTFQIRASWDEMHQWRESKQTLLLHDTVDVSVVARSLARGFRAVGYEVDDSVKVLAWGKVR